MTAVPFDTLKAARNLRAAGFEEGQAQVLVETLSSGIGDDLVTKAYLDIRFDSLEQRMTLKLGGVIVAAVGVASTVMTLIIKLV